MYVVMYHFYFIFEPGSSTFTSWSTLGYFKQKTALVLVANCSVLQNYQKFQMSFMSIYSDVHLAKLVLATLSPKVNELPLCDCSPGGGKWNVRPHMAP